MQKGPGKLPPSPTPAADHCLAPHPKHTLPIIQPGAGGHVSGPLSPRTELSRPLLLLSEIQAGRGMLLTGERFRTPMMQMREKGFRLGRPLCCTLATTLDGLPVTPQPCSSTQQRENRPNLRGHHRTCGECGQSARTHRGSVNELSVQPETLTLVVHKSPAELLEGASVAHGPQGAVELVVGHHQVLGVPSHVYDLWRDGGTAEGLLLQPTLNGRPTSSPEVNPEVSPQVSPRCARLRLQQRLTLLRATASGGTVPECVTTFLSYTATLQ